MNQLKNGLALGLIVTLLTVSVGELVALDIKDYSFRDEMAHDSSALLRFSLMDGRKIDRVQSFHLDGDQIVFKNDSTSRSIGITDLKKIEMLTVESVKKPSPLAGGTDGLIRGGVLGVAAATVFILISSQGGQGGMQFAFYTLPIAVLIAGGAAVIGTASGVINSVSDHPGTYTSAVLVEFTSETDFEKRVWLIQNLNF